MKSKIEQMYDAAIRDKYQNQDGKLKIEPTVRPLTVLVEDSSPSVHYHNRQAELKTRFGMQGLQLEGKHEPPRATTLADAVIDKDRDDMRGLKLATAKVALPNKPAFRFWYTISK